jgi:hypothetical protein
MCCRSAPRSPKTTARVCSSPEVRPEFPTRPLPGNNNGIVNSGVVETRSNNTIHGNTTDLSGHALTPLDGV